MSRQAGNAALAAAIGLLGLRHAWPGRSGRRPGAMCDGLSESMSRLGRHRFAVDDRRIGAAELAGDLLQRRLHRLPGVFLG